MKKVFNFFNTKSIFWKTIKSELNAIKKDKAVLGTFVSVTVIILVVYTYIYSYEVVKEVPVAIVNQDGTKMSRDYIAMLDATEGTKTIVTFTDLQEAKNAYYSKKVMGIVIVPKDFEKDIRSGRQTTITTFSDAANMIFYKTVISNVTAINGYFSAGIYVKKQLAKGKTPSEAIQSFSPIQGISTSLFNANAGYATYLVPILTALIVQLVLLMGIGLINGTRHENGKFSNHFPVLLNKGGTISVLLAKASLYTGLFLLLIPIQIGIVYTLFSIPVKSSLLTIYVFLIPYVFSVVFLGIAISYLFKRREDSILFLVLFSIPSLMLSGLSFPVESFSVFYQWLSKILPSTAGINGFVRLTQMSASFSEVLNEWLQLWVLTIIYFVFAAITLKRRVGKEQD